MLVIRDKGGFAVVTAAETLTRQDDESVVPAFECLVRRPKPGPMLIDDTRLEAARQGLWQEVHSTAPPGRLWPDGDRRGRALSGMGHQACEAVHQG